MMHVKVGEQPMVVHSFLLSCRSQWSHSGLYAWHQVFLPTMLSQQTLDFDFSGLPTLGLNTQTYDHVNHEHLHVYHCH